MLPDRYLSPWDARFAATRTHVHRASAAQGHVGKTTLELFTEADVKEHTVRLLTVLLSPSLPQGIFVLWCTDIFSSTSLPQSSTCSMLPLDWPSLRSTLVRWFKAVQWGWKACVDTNNIPWSKISCHGWVLNASHQGVVFLFSGACCGIVCMSSFVLVALSFLIHSRRTRCETSNNGCCNECLEMNVLFFKRLHQQT